MMAARRRFGSSVGINERRSECDPRLGYGAGAGVQGTRLPRTAGRYHMAAAAARGGRLQIQNRDELLQQRARRIADRFQERTADEAQPLSRERVREVIQTIVAALDEERLRESAG